MSDMATMTETDAARVSRRSAAGRLVRAGVAATYQEAMGMLPADAESACNMIRATLVPDDTAEFRNLVGRMGMMGAWVAGHTGYLPESEPGAFASWRDAAEYLRGEMIYHAQEDDERVYEVYGVGTEDEPIGATAEAEVRAIWRDDPPREGEPWGVILVGQR